MKLLIAYDNSSYSDAALDDLTRAGLPDECEASILSVAEVWLPPTPENETLKEYVEELQTKPQPFKAFKEHAQVFSKIEAQSVNAGKHLQTIFPKWRISAEATYGSPAWEILSRATDLKSDLIVVGTHGHSALGRLFLGSISQKVLTEAKCSVRVARGKTQINSPLRIVVGFDGSPGSLAAVEAIAARTWSERPEIRLVAAINPITPSLIGRIIPPLSNLVDEANESELDWIKKLTEKPLQNLRDAGFAANLHVHAGHPKKILIEEAEDWNADCIFVGANAFGNAFEKFLIGSTSAAVAARAHCSVEVVRKKTINSKN